MNLKGEREDPCHLILKTHYIYICIYICTHTTYMTHRKLPIIQKVILLAKVPSTVFHDSYLKNSYLLTTCFGQSLQKDTEIDNFVLEGKDNA